MQKRGRFVFEYRLKAERTIPDFTLKHMSTSTREWTILKHENLCPQSNINPAYIWIYHEVVLDHKCCILFWKEMRIIRNNINSTII